MTFSKSVTVAVAVATIIKLDGVYAAKKSAKSTSNTQVVHHGAPSYACPSGFELQGKKCARLIEKPLIPYCLSGELDGHGNCIEYMPAEKICPVGFNFEGKQCSRQNTAARYPLCPTGFTLANGVCKKQNNVPLKYVCEPGFADTGHQCTTRDFVDPLYYCPDNKYTLKGGRCVTTLFYDCSPNAPAPLPSQLSKGETLLDSFKKHLRVLGKKKTSYVAPIAPAGKEQPPQKEHFIVKQQCQKIEEIDALKRCPGDSIPEGKKCIITEIRDKLAKCPASGTIDNCFEWEQVEPDYVCPQGFEDTLAAGSIQSYGKKSGGLYNEGLCASLEITEYKLMCSHDWSLLDDRCTRHFPAEFMCEGGMKPKHGKKGHGHGSSAQLECSYMDYAEPIVTYNVKYTCTGKECHNNGAHSHGHH